MGPGFNVLPKIPFPAKVVTAAARPYAYLRTVNERYIRPLVAVAALLLFMPFLGAVPLFDWDEINFAECAREMMVTGDYMHVTIDYAPFYEKPPLFLWLQVASMHVFGVNEFAARLPNAVIGMITLVVLYGIGRRLHGIRVALLWCAAMAGSLLPHFYFRSGIIDPLFNLFIFLGVMGMQGAMRERGASDHGLRAAALAGVAAGLAVLTKGPVGWGLVGLTSGVVWLVQRKRIALPWRQLTVMTVVAVAVTSVWFGLDYVLYGPTFMLENLKYQMRLLTTGDAGHEQPWFYHPVVVFIGCFPASVLMFGGLRSRTEETDPQRAMRLWMIVLLLVVLVVFSAVKTKIVHYSSLTYLPLTYLAAIGIDRVVRGARPWSRLATVLIVVMGTLLSAAIAVVPYLFAHPELLLGSPTFRDVFLRSAITRPVAWTGLEPWTALILFAGVIAFVVMRGKRPAAAIATLFGSVALCISVFLPAVAPKIERHTQGAMIDFYQSLRGKDVYVKPLTMKSYAHLFYTDKPRHLSAAARSMPPDAWEPWLLEGAIDRPAYFVAKVNDAERWRAHPALRVVREEGGYVFFERVNPRSASSPAADRSPSR